LVFVNLAAGECGKSRQRANAEVFEIDDALGVVALEGESAMGESAAGPIGEIDVFGFGIINDGVAIDFDDDMFTLNQDVLGIPLVVLGGCQAHFRGIIQAAGFLGVGMADVDLAFVAFFRPVGLLVLGVEVDTGV